VRTFIAGLGILCATSAVAGPAIALSSPDPLPQAVNGSDAFLQPNETTPRAARAVWAKAPAGAYVTVGTDRGFIAAGLAPRVTDLVLVDLNPRAVVINRINIALLRLARSRDEYLRWRTQPLGFDDWQVLFQKASVPPADRELLGDHRAWVAWQWGIVRNPKLDRFHTDPRFVRPVRRDTPFLDANYLYYPAQFRRVQKLARSGHISAHQLDLTRPDSVRELVLALQQANIPISVLDLSNAWDHDAMTAAQFADVLHAFEPVLRKGSRLLVTDLIYDPGRPDERWNYWSFPRSAWIGPQADRLAETLRRLERQGMSCAAVLRALRAAGQP
jgi:hypothetical protein